MIEERDFTELVSRALNARGTGISPVARASAGAVTDPARVEWRPGVLTAEEFNDSGS